MKITYEKANHSTDLEQILALQKANLKENISIEEASKEGFVTVKHDFETLALMNQSNQHILAKDGDKLVGYALLMERSMAKKVPVLVPMFNLIDASTYQSELLKNKQYVVMGQVCIHKDYRGKGIFKGLFEKFQQVYATKFDYLITEISASNIRSQKAHQKVGFELISIHQDEVDTWHLVLWNWR
jgi:predicted GNAT family N-acyltransferase